MNERHLIIPDAHAHPNHNNNRFDWVGKLILDVKPTKVICIGDLFDFPSLNYYDKGKASSFGKRYAKDLEAGIEAQDRLWLPTRKAKRRYPKRYFFEGNHEYRITRLLSEEPKLDGLVSRDNMELKRYWDVLVWYRGSTPDRMDIGGVSYAHYHTSGILGRPISGKNQARSILLSTHVSATMGHTHTFDYSQDTTAKGGDKIMGLVCGALIDYPISYAGVGEELWWNGVVIKDFIRPGAYDLTMVGIERLRKEYGKR